ncbi:gamma-glutamyltransferase [Kaistia algarum]|nr:gamma-glutamyltransferase [Kaistia algarum]MCX5515723.1 gamma-glutamyltransferase [Kaistia algarum]
MVASDQALAAEVGAEILRAGGNAVDAAVAVGYAQAVVNPCCGNLGGGGFLTLRLADGQAAFIDFREAAPKAAGPNVFLDDQGEVIPRASLDGWRAAGVPGTVAGLELALSRFGTMKRADVMAPAIRLAHDGFILTRPDADIIGTGLAAFRADPALAQYWLRDGEPLKAGDRLVQTQLATTLQGISDKGPDYFYKGPIAAAIVDASRRKNGLFSADDFARYEARIGKPLECSYRGYEILTAAPPSAGGLAVCEILNILEFYPVGYLGFGSADMVHLMTEAMRHAFVDRNSAIGDPAFVKNPVERLVSKDYAAALRLTIDPYKATPSETLSGTTSPHEGTETTSFSVVDKAGNAVAVTYSLNAYFGARVMAPGTGFFLNNTMDDFTSKVGAANMFGLVQGAANAIAPGKRPVSSMAPTIVVKDGRPFMVLGSPGGSRIITAVVETILNVVDFGMTIQEAVNAPRVHAQWLPDILFAEPYALSPDTVRALAERGHKVRLQKPWGAVEAILLGSGAAQKGELPSFGDDTVRGEVPRLGYIYGGHDARRPAGAAIAE